ncbi:MAG: hypothetical protein HY869_21025 [Chloroflexi bacterium]|nr:hypothetical protein [Chloroflexota bacterium]
MPVNSDVLDTLRKIQALAEHGLGGEREAAQWKLDLLLKRHGLTLDDVLVEREDEKLFGVENEMERDLLIHVVGVVKNIARVTVYKINRSRKKVLVRATPAQMVEIERLYGAYRKALKKGIEDYYQAFLHKNQIFPDADAEGGRELTAAEREQVRRIALLLQGMKKTALPLKALKG